MQVHLDSLLGARGLRLADLAKRLGVNKSTVSRWKKKQIPAERVSEVERETGIPRHDLRPDLYQLEPAE